MGVVKEAAAKVAAAAAAERAEAPDLRAISSESTTAALSLLCLGGNKRLSAPRR